MTESGISLERIEKHKHANALHTGLLIGGMLILIALMGYLLGGLGGILWAVGIGLVLLWFSPRMSPQLMMRMYKARPLTIQEARPLYEIVAELSRRGNLPFVPRIYYIPSKMMNAFTMGNRKEAIIGITDGILRGLNLRQLAGVLAHEISHIVNNDTKVMALADIISRVTGMFSTIGQILLFSNIFLWLMGRDTFSWLLILVFLATPAVTSLLQLALSRTREYDADLDAVRLTGDPEGLALALQKLEHYHHGPFERILMPGRRVPEPSLFRTHPETEDRIKRLLELRERPSFRRRPHMSEDLIVLPQAYKRVAGPPRWNGVLGLWR